MNSLIGTNGNVPVRCILHVLHVHVGVVRVSWCIPVSCQPRGSPLWHRAIAVYEKKASAGAAKSGATLRAWEVSIESVWEAVDTDRNGVLDTEEVKKLFILVGQDALVDNEKKLARCFKALDTDGNGTVSKAEFTAWWGKQMKNMK